MRKFLFSIILSLFGLLLFHTPTYACGDNSGGIAPVGPKIAGNIQVENYAEISERWCQENPQYANMIIPVTIIYTGSDFKGDINNPEDPAYHTAGNLNAMYANGLFPVIRTWGNMEGEEAIQAGRTLNALSNQLQQKYGITKPFSVYFGNEPNLQSEGFHVDPNRYAASMDNFLQGTGYNPNFPLYMPPIAGHQSTTGLTNEQAFAAQILNATMSDGSKLYQNMDGAFLTIYQPNAQAAIADMKSWWNFFKNGTDENGNPYNISKIAISEIGPFSNNHLLQNPGDIGEWQRIMSEMFAYFKAHPEELDFDGDGIIDIEFMNTSFFRDLDGDGFPDITDLVIVDEFGNAIVDTNALLIGGGFGWPEGYNPTLSCPSEDQGTFRPKAYSAACKVQKVPDKVEVKVDNFQITTKIKLHIDDAMQNFCNGDYYPQTTWDATVGIDPSLTYYPQAGFGKSYNTDNPEAEYLADYITGSLFTEEGKQPKLLQDWDHAGIFRKISTGWYQDEKKCDLTKSSNANYPVVLSILSYDLKNIPCPPIDKPITDIAWTLWKIRNPLAHQLWDAISNFTYQDTPGDLIAEAVYPPSELSTSDKGSESDGPNKIISALSVPHAQRVNDASEEMIKLMAPAGLENIDPKKTSGFGSLSQNTKQEIPAPKTKLLSLIDNFQDKLSKTLTQIKNKAIALAQGTSTPPGTNNCEQGNDGGMHMIVHEENGGIQIHAWNTQPEKCGDPSDYEYHVRYFWNGEEIGSCDEYQGGGAYLPRHNPNGSPEEKYGLWINGMANCSIPQSEIMERNGGSISNWQDHFTVQYWINSSHGLDIPGCSKTRACNVNEIPPTPPLPPPPPPCGYNFNKPTVTINSDPDEKEPDKLNNVRKNPIIIKVHNPDAGPMYPLSQNNASKIKAKCDTCDEEDTTCKKEKCYTTLIYGTQIELKSHFPYNKTIFENFAQERETGFLNYFIPQGTGKGFEKDNNSSKIGLTLYSLTAEKSTKESTITILGGPSAGLGQQIEGKIESGLYLFGAQKAKQCVSQRLFVPSFAGQSVECPDLL